MQKERGPALRCRNAGLVATGSQAAKAAATFHELKKPVATVAGLRRSTSHRRLTHDLSRSKKTPFTQPAATTPDMIQARLREKVNRDEDRFGMTSLTNAQSDHDEIDHYDE